MYEDAIMSERFDYFSDKSFKQFSHLKDMWRLHLHRVVLYYMLIYFGRTLTHEFWYTSTVESLLGHHLQHIFLLCKYLPIFYTVLLWTQFTFSYFLICVQGFQNNKGIPLEASFSPDSRFAFCGKMIYYYFFFIIKLSNQWYVYIGKSETGLQIHLLDLF